MMWKISGAKVLKNEVLPLKNSGEKKHTVHLGIEYTWK